MEFPALYNSGGCEATAMLINLLRGDETMVLQLILKTGLQIIFISKNQFTNRLMDF